MAGGRPVRSISRVRVRAERVDQIRRARVLPHDRVMPRPARARVPHDRRLALVGDADRGEITSSEPGGAQRAGDHLVHARRDLDRVVLDPAGARQDLPVLDLPPRDFAAAGIEHHEPRAGCSLVEGAYEHGRHITGSALPMATARQAALDVLPGRFRRAARSCRSTTWPRRRRWARCGRGPDRM